MEDQAAAVEALGVAIAARVPVLLWGAPGTGKTSVIRALAAAAGWPCETVIASIREPSDFAGLPIVHRDGDDAAGPRVDFAPPRWAADLARAGHGIAFFDEVSTAPPAVQAALLRVVLERTVGDLTLPDEVSVVAAANPPDQAADGWELSPPLANRFCHLDWTLDARALAEGFSSGWPSPRPPSLRELFASPRRRGLAALAAAVRHRLSQTTPASEIQSTLPMGWRPTHTASIRSSRTIATLRFFRGESRSHSQPAE